MEQLDLVHVSHDMIWTNGLRITSSLSFNSLNHRYYDLLCTVDQAGHGGVRRKKKLQGGGGQSKHATSNINYS